jgi:hypothetical protein
MVATGMWDAGITRTKLHEMLLVARDLAAELAKMFFFNLLLGARPRRAKTRIWRHGRIRNT